MWDGIHTPLIALLLKILQVLSLEFHWWDTAFGADGADCAECRETGDERVKPILAALVAFFESQNVILAGYTLDGVPLEPYTHICFQAPVWCLFKVWATLCRLSAQGKISCSNCSCTSTQSSSMPRLHITERLSP